MNKMQFKYKNIDFDINGVEKEEVIESFFPEKKEEEKNEPVCRCME